MNKKNGSQNELFNLMAENPNLPVVPMVDAEICGDDYNYWVGALAAPRIDEYVVTGEGVRFRSDDDGDLGKMQETVNQYDIMPIYDKDKLLMDKYESLPWEKAIIVYITLPEPPKED